MLRLWPERFVASLSPAGVPLAHLASGGGPGDAEHWSAPCADAGTREPWRPQLEALSTELARRKSRRLRCRVVLSNHYVRFQVVPWHDTMQSGHDRARLARAQYRSVFGEVAEDWEICLETTAYGMPVLACAVERALLSALGAIAARAHIDSVEPHAAAAFNRWRRELPAEHFRLAVLEPGRLWLGQAEKGGWVSVAARLLAGRDAVSEVLSCIEQETAASPAELPVYLVTTGLDRMGARRLSDAGLRVLTGDRGITHAEAAPRTREPAGH